MGDTIELPAKYAQGKLRTLRKRWDGPMGDAVRAHGPTLWPGVPLTALVGLSASSMGQREAGGPPDYATGLYGVEANRLPELCEKAGAYLGRPVSPKVRTGTYRDLAGVKRPCYLDDPEGQVVTGLMGYLKHLDAVIAATDPALWTDGARASSWALRVAAAAYSSGDAAARAVLLEWPGELAALPLEWRWPDAAARVAAFVGDRIQGRRVRGKWRLGFMHLRAEQRAMSGLWLEVDLHHRNANVEWFAGWADEARHAATVARLRELADWRADDEGDE